MYTVPCDTTSYCVEEPYRVRINCLFLRDDHLVKLMIVSPLSHKYCEQLNSGFKTIGVEGTEDLLYCNIGLLVKTLNC